MTTSAKKKKCGFAIIYRFINVLNIFIEMFYLISPYMLYARTHWSNMIIDVLMWNCRRDDRSLPIYMFSSSTTLGSIEYSFFQIIFECNYF